MRENINFRTSNSSSTVFCVVLLFFYPYLYQDKRPSVFPNCAKLSAVKVTKTATLNGKHSEPSYIADLIKCKVHNEHLSLIVDLLHLSPAKVMCLARALEGKNATVVDAKVQLVAPVILQQASWLHLSK